MKDLTLRRPRLALPYTILTEPDTVRLVAGEDFRYTLTGPELHRWLPDFLVRLDGRQPLTEALQTLTESDRVAARQLVERLYGERILTDAAAAEAHPAIPCRLVLEGTGPLLAALGDGDGDDSRAAPLLVLSQDRLDYEAALRFNRRCLAGGSPWLWVSSGPMSRGYVSPVFLPDAGPCLACLLRQFQRLSPAPELYDALREHARCNRPVAPVPFPVPALRMLEALVRWKATQLAAPPAPAALYRLHVLEVETLEVTTHRLFADPECPECRERR